MMLKYETLIQDACNTLPNFKNVYISMTNEGKILSLEDGSHIVFGLVFNPLITEFIQKDTSEKKQYFDFLEQMASSDDISVGEICDFTIMEYLCSKFKDSDIYPYFGENTKKSFFAIRQYIGDRNSDGSPKYS